MGAWEELDTEINTEMDLSELDEILNMDDPYGIFEPLQPLAQELKDNIQAGTKRGVEEVAKKNVSMQEKWINQNCKNPSGMLASSIDYEMEDEYTAITGTRINHVYPMSVEYGHTDIYPVRAKALAFYDDTGELIFRKHVSDTFDNPRPFVAPAYEDTKEFAEQLVVDEIGHAGVNWD